ncbi:MAG: hypothetical protein CL843_06645 [Crocinitomicaceae bacterium]|nr:hypothetical protein [Crocinitomicaceae bacterium]|tara:strand:+ start:4104 stop:5240 length:1137 start_codon:yes stop_codon:yes gene_type:complete
MPFTALAQKTEQQISFAQESKPHAYYVEQAELWAKELAQDSLSENAWYNYFRACRNAHGTADWKSDFVRESPYLMEGETIVQLIHKHIPNTFTDHYLSYLTNGIGTSHSEDLLKAYSMNPNFPGIHSSVISYAESSMDYSLRKKTNRTWYPTNYISSQLLNYSYNVLMSLDSNAILFVQHDNDTYPTWMLQDALGVRTDVKVISIDFLLLENYRETVYDQLNILQLDLEDIDSDEYHQNWEKVVAHIITNYTGSRPVYFGMTLFNHLYADFENQLFVSGLALRYSEEKQQLAAFNKKLYEAIFLLDYLTHHFGYDKNQGNVNHQNINYISCFKIVYDHYVAEGKDDEATQVKSLALAIANQTKNPELVTHIENEFNRK